MTVIHKIIKYLSAAFAIFLTVTIIGGALNTVGLFGGFFTESAVTEDMKLYPISNDIHSLDIEISSADLYIKKGDKFLIESNLNGLSVVEKDGCLTINDPTASHMISFGSYSYENANLTVYVPTDTVFKSVDIHTITGKFTVDSLSAETVSLELGAGEVKIGSLTATSSATVEGGAGRVTVSDGSLNCLSMEMGVGELNLTSRLQGNCNLDMGVGKSNITLVGERDDYSINVEKGLGGVSVDGNKLTGFGSIGKGACALDINGGVGAINIRFKK